MPISRRTFMESAAAAALFAVSRGAAAQDASPAKRRVCIIGDTKAGGYGHSLHLAWSQRDDVEIVGLADPDEAGRAKHAAECGAQRTYADYRAMLEQEKPEFVTIGPRYTERHREYVLACAEYNAHGFMEKPITSDLAQADDMIAAIEAKNLKWSIGFNFRATPAVQHIKRLVFEEGLIGDVLEMRGRGKEDQRAGGEDLMVLGTHIFDMMRFFAGDALWCSADITCNGVSATIKDMKPPTEPIGPILGDRIHAMYGFSKGLVGYFATTKNPDGNGNRWGLDLFGSKGMVTIRQDGGPLLALNRTPSWAPAPGSASWEPIPDAPPNTIKDPARENYAPIISDLIAAVNENRRPAVSMQDGRASLEMIQAVYESHLRGARVPLPLADRTHPLTRSNPA